ncbi:MAG: hypothetical protein ACOYCB_05210 [Fastidiosipilaceae bacterium]|jgi:hypothetical protein|nr:hypothetical protein [Clostridiaceae bacterium]
MTNQQKKFNDVSIVETELSVPRKGSVRVRIDLDNRILSWRESNRWNRNFTRTINQKEVNMVRQAITNYKLFKLDRPSEKSDHFDPHLSCTWQVSVYCDDAEPVNVWHGSDMDDDGFIEWTELMGHVCRQLFDVVD